MELKPGYKQTEVGVIPEDWGVISIGKACRLINGRGFKPHEWENSGLPIIRIQNLNGSNEYNYFSGDYDSKIEVHEGQLLFAWSGSRGTSFGPHIWHGPKALLNYHTWKVAINEKVLEPDYFYHALKKLTSFIEDKAHGASALVHTQKWEMEKFPIAVPTCTLEQADIANALSSCDKLLSDLEALLRKKRNIKQAAMQELLTGKRRLPGSQGEWEVKRLGEIATIDPENLGSSTQPDYRFNYISLEDVDHGSLLNWSEQEFSSAPSRARRRLRRNDVLVSTVRPDLKSHLLFGHDTGEWVCSTGFSTLRCNGDLADPLYVYFHLFGDLINKQIESLLTGSNYPAISSRDVRSLEIPVPALPEQKEIASVLRSMEEEICSLAERLEKTCALKQGMMQQLLTGKIRLT